jgi:hypothetical protein
MIHIYLATHGAAIQYLDGTLTTSELSVDLEVQMEGWAAYQSGVTRYTLSNWY